MKVLLHPHLSLSYPNNPMHPTQCCGSLTPFNSCRGGVHFAFPSLHPRFFAMQPDPRVRAHRQAAYYNPSNPNRQGDLSLAKMANQFFGGDVLALALPSLIPRFLNTSCILPPCPAASFLLSSPSCCTSSILCKLPLSLSLTHTHTHTHTHSLTHILVAALAGHGGRRGSRDLQRSLLLVQIPARVPCRRKYETRSHPPIPSPLPACFAIASWLQRLLIASADVFPISISLTRTRSLHTECCGDHGD